MTTFVVDASVAIKWVVEEPDSDIALRIRGADRLVAPELWVAECANILWKKVRRGELTPVQALDAAEILRASGVEVIGGEPSLPQVVSLAMSLDHPAYDCVYLRLATDSGWILATADRRLLDRLRGTDLERHALSVDDAARLVAASALPQG